MIIAKGTADRSGAGLEDCALAWIAVSFIRLARTVGWS